MPEKVKSKKNNFFRRIWKLSTATFPVFIIFYNQKIFIIWPAQDLKKRSTVISTLIISQRLEAEFYGRIYFIPGVAVQEVNETSWKHRNKASLYNPQFKGFANAFGLYMCRDGRGYQRLVIEKMKKKLLKPLYTFNLLLRQAQSFKKLAETFICCKVMLYKSWPSPTGELLPAVDIMKELNKLYLNSLLPTLP